MPNTTISFYLSDEEYVKYVSKKKEISAKVREAVKTLINSQ